MEHPQEAYCGQVLDHLGLVAGMFEELGIAEVIDEATAQNPEMRIVTAGQAVKAMVLNGLGVVNQQLYLVPHFFQNKPTPRPAVLILQLSARIWGDFDLQAIQHKVEQFVPTGKTQIASEGAQVIKEGLAAPQRVPQHTIFGISEG